MVLSNVVACPTIYRNNEIDFDEQVDLLLFLEQYFEEVIIFGSTGDQMAISVDEKIEFIEYLEKEVSLKIKKIYAVGGSNTKEVLKLTSFINKNTSCNLIMLTSVPYLCLNQNELFEYVSQVKRLFFGKIMLYNNYKRTGNKFEVNTINRLIEGNYIVCLKDVSGLDPDMINAPVLSGFDSDFFDSRYDGVTSVLGNIMPNTIKVLVRQRNEFKHRNELCEVVKCMNGIGFIKSLKFLLTLESVTLSYETIHPMQKVTLDEMLALYELYIKRINVLETIYDNNLEFEIK